MLKYGRILAATAIFVCLAVFLCACKGADDTPTEPDFSTPWSEAPVFTMPSEAEQTAQAQGAEADTDAILRRIETARAVFGMFSETRPQLDKTDSIEIEKDLFAYRVSDPKLDTMEKLQKYVSGYFSDDITQRLLNVGIFIENEGKLYALDVGMKQSQAGELHVEVTEQTDTSERYRLTVGSDTEHVHDFVYAKQADGKWVFTRFDVY